MRALRRIATPASVAAVLTGCTYQFDDFLPRATDAGLSTNADAAANDRGDGGAVDGIVASDTFDGVADTEAADSSPADTFVVDTSVNDTLVAETLDAPIEDTAIEDSFSPDTAPADTYVPPDACVCVRYTGAKCREWSPPGCGD
jgi:hypothetical protein